MIAKLKKVLKNNLNILLTLIIGLTIISIIYTLQSVAPFGNKSLLAIDFYHQYAPMLGELFDRVKNSSNLLYSFSIGLGLPFFKNFLNYLSSPFNILIFLFKRENLLMSFSVIIALKAITSSATMMYYINKKFQTSSLWYIPISLLYGFCAYFGAYYWNIMWLDGLVFLPLIILGIEKIIKENKCSLYIISLSLMLIANYFIGFMICLFSVIYFFIFLYINMEKVNIKYIIRKSSIFAGSSILAGGITAFLLLPLFLGINTISATADVWPSSQYYSFTISEFLANHISGVGSTVLATGVSNAPNISAGILCVALLLLFILNPKINTKIKIGYLVLLMIIITSFFWAPLDFIWHAFHVPNDLPYRYSFVYTFILIIISAYSINKIKYHKVSTVGIVYIILMLAISSLYILRIDNIDNSVILLNYLLISLYFIVYLLYFYYPKVSKKLPYLILLVVLLEISISINTNWGADQEIKTFYEDYSASKETLQFIEENHDGSMYRVEKNITKTFNDPSWYGYNGQMIFSSMAYEKMAILQSNLGMPGNKINSYYYKQNTPIYDLIFNINYIIGDTWDINRYDLFYNEEGQLVFKSNFNPNLFYAVDKKIKNWNYLNENPFKIQNDFVSKSTGINDVLTKISIRKKELIYNDEKQIYKYTTSNTDDNIYFYINENIDFIIVNDTMYHHNNDFQYADKLGDEVNIFDFKSLSENFVIPIRTDNETLDFYVGYSNYESDSFFAYYINDNSFKDAVDILRNNVIKITNFKENNINVNINLSTDKTIYSSVPFDKGWKVSSSGKNIKTFTIGSSMLGFDLLKGEHTVNIKYIPYGLYLGIVISVVSLISTTTLYILKKKKS